VSDKPLFVSCLRRIRNVKTGAVAYPVRTERVYPGGFVEVRDPKTGRVGSWPVEYVARKS
jgi:hypothetical protein